MTKQRFIGTYKMWTFIDPRRALLAIAAFLSLLGILIHFVTLGSDLNWHSDGIPQVYFPQTGEPLNTSHMSPLPPNERFSLL